VVVRGGARTISGVVNRLMIVGDVVPEAASGRLRMG
jgi:hypothetical protein